MLVLTRKRRQSIIIGDDVEVIVLSIAPDKIRLGIQAPREIPVLRSEVHARVRPERDARAQVDEAIEAVTREA
jgi:carbon storage regulator